MKDEIKPLRSALLDDLVHGFFTRKGGVSVGIFGTLNMGIRNADLQENVAENRRRVEHSLAVGPNHLAVAKQVHGIAAIRVEAPWNPHEAPEADAVISASPDIAAGVYTADCVPVLIADQAGNNVAAIHAGWRSALDGIIEATVTKLTDLGAGEPNTFRVAIGPSIRQASYEVGEEYRAQFVAKDPSSAQFFTDQMGHQPHFDLPGYVGHLLSVAGIQAIDDLGHCTCAEEDLFFSNRRSFKDGSGGFGLQVSAIRPNQ